MKVIIYIAAIIGIFGSFFIEFLPKGSYYVLTALFIALLCTHIFLSKRNSFIRFVLFGLSISNLADELFFDPTVLQLNEVLIAVSLIGIWMLKKLLYGSENYRQ